jgi:tetratricopeptide (TPR) repeat protein
MASFARFDHVMEYSVEYKRLIRAWRTIDYESDCGRRTEKLKRLITDLTALKSTEPENAEILHLIGLCWYELPEDSDSNLRQAEEAFRLCLATDSHHQYANFYLGHVLFDFRRYEEALERFDKVEPDFFLARSQQWRVVKNEELRLCCRLEIEPASVAFQELDEMCQRYEADRILPEPGEIVKCLDSLVKREAPPAASLQAYVLRVLEMLKVSDNLDVRYLREPITRLCNLVAHNSPAIEQALGADSP